MPNSKSSQRCDIFIDIDKLLHKVLRMFVNLIHLNDVGKLITKIDDNVTIVGNGIIRHHRVSP